MLPMWASNFTLNKEFDLPSTGNFTLQAKTAFEDP